jgi:hypothetical protein
MLMYSAADLSAFCAIITRSAVSRNWSAPTEVNDRGVAVQEVQCMLMDAKLYFAGNFSEHASIAAFLNAFGVDNEDTLLDCMRYSHWLLTIPVHKRTEVTGFAYPMTFSDTEGAALSLSAVLPFEALSAPEIAEARALLDGKTTARTLREERLGWFLRKFVAAGPFVRKPYVKSNVSVTMVTNAVQPASINVVNNNADVHAELKLLAFMTGCALANQVKLSFKAVQLGGLKKTCRMCAAWVGYFKYWLYKEHRIDVQLPLADDRPSGAGAGDRPTCAAAVAWGDYPAALFNGLANSLCVDMAPLKVELELVK